MDTAELVRRDHGHAVLNYNPALRDSTLGTASVRRSRRPARSPDANA